MKKLLLPLFALIMIASNAQFSFAPQLGVEGLKTSIWSNNFTAFSPANTQLVPRLGVRMAYQFKKVGSAFVGIATGSPTVEMKFTDPETAQTSYKVSNGNLKFRLEAGYQFTTKSIALGKPAVSKDFGHNFNRGSHQSYSRGTRCGINKSTSRCGKSSYKKAPQNTALFMRIKPSAGLAFTPGASNEMETATKGGTTTYEYNTGFSTALIAGTTFEFGSRTLTKFTVSINYLKSLGNNEQTVYSGIGKTSAYNFMSRTSGFNLSLGFPLSFAKKMVQQPPQRSHSSKLYSRGSCGKYKMVHSQ